MIQSVRDRFLHLLEDPDALDELAVSNTDYRIRMEAQLRLQIEEERYRTFQNAIEIGYLKAIATERSQQLERLRSFYLQEITVLKSELQYYTKTIRTDPSSYDAEVTEIPIAEREILLGLLKVERSRVERLQKWVSNLKVQLSMEKLRESQVKVIDLIHPDPTIQEEKKVTFQNHDEQKNPFQDLIAELQNQISLLEDQNKQLERELDESKTQIANQNELKQIHRQSKQPLDVLSDTDLKQRNEQLIKDLEAIKGQNQQLQQRIKQLEQANIEKTSFITKQTEKFENEIRILKSIQEAKANAPVVQVITKRKDNSKTKQLEAENLQLKDTLKDIQRQMDGLKMQILNGPKEKVVYVEKIVEKVVERAVERVVEKPTGKVDATPPVIPVLKMAMKRPKVILPTSGVVEYVLEPTKPLEVKQDTEEKAVISGPLLWLKKAKSTSSLPHRSTTKKEDSIKRSWSFRILPQQEGFLSWLTNYRQERTSTLKRVSKTWIHLAIKLTHLERAKARLIQRQGSEKFIHQLRALMELQETKQDGRSLFNRTQERAMKRQAKIVASKNIMEKERRKHFESMERVYGWSDTKGITGRLIVQSPSKVQLI
jgi:hypothetical protein